MSLELPERMQALERLRELRERIEEITRLAEGANEWTPAADLLDEGDSYRLMVDVPGVKHQDLELLEEGSAITLAGVRSSLEGHYLKRERPQQQFKRTLVLPGPIQERSAQASLRNGVLEVVFKKAASEKINVTPEETP